MNSETIHNLSRAALTLLLDSMVRGMIVLLAAGGAVCFMRRASAAARHRLWLVAILAAGLMPLLVLMPGWRVLPARALHAETAGATPFDRAVEESAPVVVDPVRRVSSALPQVSSPAPVRRLTMPVVIDWVGAVWLIGVVGMSGRLLLSRRMLARLGRGVSPASDGLQSTLRSAAAQLGLHRDIRLLESLDRTIMPMTWGFVRPTILLPGSACDWSASRRRMVMLHELSHTRRCDYAWLVLAEFTSAIFWFNPLWRWALKHLRDEAEQACDETVLSIGEDRYTYAAELLATVTAHARDHRMIALALGMSRCSTLESRLKLILDDAHPPRQAHAGLITLIVFLLVAAPLSQIRLVAQAQSEPAQPKPDRSGETVRYGGVVRDENGKPIEGVHVKVSLFMPDNQSLDDDATTDASGRWSIAANPKSEVFQIYATSRDFLHFVKAYPDADVMRAGTLQMSLARGLSIKGVVRSADGAVIAGAEIRPQFATAPVVSDADGRFVVSGLQRVRQVLVVTAKNLAPCDVWVDADDFSSPLNVLLSNGKTLTGVLTGPDRKPIADATVSASNWEDVELFAADGGSKRYVPLQPLDISAKTDANGRYRLEHIPTEGSVELIPSAPGLMGVRVRVGASNASPHDLIAVKPAQLHGTVIDAVTRKPVRRFKIACATPFGLGGRGFLSDPNSPRARTIQSATGTFDLTVDDEPYYRAEQEFHVIVSADGYVTAGPAVSRLPDGSPVTIQLEAAVPVQGQVRDSSGAPAKGATAMLMSGNLVTGGAQIKTWTRQARRSNMIVETDAAGAFKLPPSGNPGNALVINAQGYAVLEAYMLRREKSPTLTLTPWGRLDGVVLRRGRPVEDALVQLQGYLSAGGPSDSGTPHLILWTQTSADGKFEFPNLPTGDMSVLVSPAPGTRTRASVDAGKTEHITINVAE